MSNKIATREYCNTIQANTFTTDLTRCPKYQEIEDAGLQVAAGYKADQLIKQEDISSNINYITVSVTNESGQTTIYGRPKYTDIPASTIEQMDIDLYFSSGQRIMFKSYSWDEDELCWKQYSWKTPEEFGVLNAAKSTISITEDSKYKYALAEPEKLKVHFKFVLEGDRVYMAFDRQGNTSDYETMAMVSTNIGEFRLISHWEWYLPSYQEVSLPFGVNSIEVLNIVNFDDTEFIQGDFEEKRVRVKWANPNGYPSFNGHVVMSINEFTNTSGMPAADVEIPIYSIGQAIYLTYNASPAGHQWMVRNKLSGSAYTLKDGVTTHVGYATDDTDLEFYSYS